MSKNIKIVFWLLIVFFAISIFQIFIPIVTGIVFLLPFVVFSLLGLVLVILVLKQKVKTPLKKYLLLTGISALSFFILVVLHNGFYALGIMVNNSFLKWVIGALGMVTFLAGIFVSPIAFVVGWILSYKKR